MYKICYQLIVYFCPIGIRLNMSSGNVNVCDIDDEVREELRKFRFEKHDSNCALILKVDRQQRMVRLDERLQPVDPDQLRESLPDHQPRYIIYR